MFDCSARVSIVPHLLSSVPQVLKCRLRDFVDRNPGYTSFLAQRQGLSDHNPGGGVTISDYSYASGVAGGAGGAGAGSQGNADDAAQVETGQGLVVFWERAVGSRLAEMFRWEPVIAIFVHSGCDEVGSNMPLSGYGVGLLKRRVS